MKTKKSESFFMKWYRAGIMRKQFDILPTIFVRWFIGYQGTRKFDIHCS